MINPNAWRIVYEQGNHIPGRGFVRASSGTLHVPGTAREAAREAAAKTREPGFDRSVVKVYDPRNGKLVMECRKTIYNRTMTRSVRGRAVARCHIHDAAFKRGARKKARKR